MRNNETIVIDVVPSTSTNQFEKNPTKDFSQSRKGAIEGTQDVSNESDGQVYYYLNYNNISQ